MGRIVITDLVNYACPFIRYDTGDLAILCNQCSCEMNQVFHLKNIVGRLDDMIITPRGRWISIPVQIFWVGKNILESQIIQDRVDHIEMLIVPKKDFTPDIMKDIIKKAKELLGEEMNVSWREVDIIPRDPRSHKIKHVIRNPKLGVPSLI